jgi:hypothetical protein
VLFRSGINPSPSGEDDRKIYDERRLRNFSSVCRRN